MKRHFSIGILLLICAHWANSAAIPVKRGIDEQTRRELAEINNERKALAENVSIANMHELVYDDNLEKRASQLTCETTLSDAMAVPMPTEEDMAKMRSLPEGGDQEKAKQVLGVLVYYAVEVLINPEQSRVGCATINLKCNLPGVGGPPVPLNGPICLVGPKSSISKSDYKQGPPGSQCPKGNGPSGLCRSRPDQRMDQVDQIKDGSGRSDKFQGESADGQKEDNASNRSSIFALLLIVFLI